MTDEFISHLSKPNAEQSKDFGSTRTNAYSQKKKVCNKKRKDGVLRKNPQAPRRFKSSYILFFMAKQEEIKRSLPKGSSVRSFHHAYYVHLCILRIYVYTIYIYILHSSLSNFI